MKETDVNDETVERIGFVSKYARMWPREVFDGFAEGSKKRTISNELEILDQSGVYVLYRDDVPYYVGKAIVLRNRLESHANKPCSRYDYFWNYFSVFVIEDALQRNTVEGILIAAMPTSNSARPKLERQYTPPAVRKPMRRIRRSRANP